MAKKPGTEIVCSVVSPQHAVKLCMQRRGPPLSEGLKSARSVCSFLRSYGNSDRENFVALHLDAGLRVNGVEEIAKGTLSGVEIHPREVFKGAILGQSAGIIIAHNHPSGRPDPSSEDRELTKRLAAAGRLLGIPVHDHVIVTDTECRSMRETEPSQFQGAGYPGAPPKRRRRL
jgi:DNA repair protein RadC